VVQVLTADEVEKHCR